MYNTQTLNKNKINSLLQEIKILRSAVIGWAGRDSEGNYNSNFIKKVLKASKESPIHKFKDKKSFLKSLKD
ncbi:MAG: hypothetical protein ABIH48_01300 [Candidatus Falkowbacteria bacterium]